MKLAVRIKPSDGPYSKRLFNKVKLTENARGEVNGFTFEGVKFFVKKGKGFNYSENKLLQSHVNEFKNLILEAQLEHEKTSTASIEKVLEENQGINNPPDDLIESIEENVLDNVEERLVDLTEQLSSKTIERTVLTPRVHYV